MPGSAMTCAEAPPPSITERACSLSNAELAVTADDGQLHGGGPVPSGEPAEHRGVDRCRLALHEERFERGSTSEAGRAASSTDLSTMTSPDLALAMSRAARFTASPITV